jgi:hypothetical protein
LCSLFVILQWWLAAGFSRGLENHFCAGYRRRIAACRFYEMFGLRLDADSAALMEPSGLVLECRTDPVIVEAR